METEKLKEEPAPADIPGLVAQARAAYQQNRIRECLALTKAVMLVDPGNSAAIEMQSAVRFDMQRDLSDARALIEESRNKPEAPKYRKAAEIILLKTLYLDPDSEGAKTLLSSIKSATEVQTVSTAAPAHTPPAQPIATPPIAAAPAVAPPVVVADPPVAAAPQPPVPPPVPVVELPPASPVEYLEKEAVVTAAPAPRAEVHATSYASEPGYPQPEAIPFTTGTTYVDRPEKKKKKQSNLTVPVVIAAIAVLGGSLLLARQHAGSIRTADASSLPAQAENTPPATTAQPVSYPLTSAVAPLPLPLDPPSPSKVAEATPVKPVLTASNAPATNSVASPAVPAGAAVPRPVPVNTAATGSLAVSSPIAAEIYLDDKYLGSTPTTLQLPAGSQTLEYRHGDLRSTMTHVVKANEVTTALVTFNVQVQLNARPWANVSIDGSPRIPMGQTPLSDVSLPIGTVLVFENSNFPSKSHKVDINDKTIQIAFP